MQFVQYPGETVFVPGGWWHAVLNLDDTVAVTQNYSSSGNFRRVWRITRTSRKKMAAKWFNKLQVLNPELAQMARDVDRADGFTTGPTVLQN